MNDRDAGEVQSGVKDIVTQPALRDLAVGFQPTGVLVEVCQRPILPVLDFIAVMLTRLRK
jgi:hypothetical protein